MTCLLFALTCRPDGREVVVDERSGPFGFGEWQEGRAGGLGDPEPGQCGLAGMLWVGRSAPRLVLV